jgi:type VI secretion system (T6SS) FHA protein/FHA domain-containing protein
MALAIEVVRTDNNSHETISCASSPVRIGRSPLNNVVLAAPWVSLHHGLIHFDEQHANYSDLGSTNGTTVMVKDQEMKLHPMVPMQILGAGQPNAELRIGVITLRVRWEAPAATGVRNDKSRGYETRLGEVSPGAVAGTAPRYPSNEGFHDPSRASYEAPRGGAPVPMYQAGMTRMVMPEDQARLRESPGSGAGHAPVAPPSMAPSAPHPDALARLSRAWAATGAAPLQLAGPERAFAETLAAVADAFARGLIELKNGLKEFGEGIGVRAVGGHSPLHRSQAASEIMNYLLDPNADTHARLEQLVDLFADLMIHEVALLNGVKAGVRQLLVELDPEQGYAKNGGGGGIGLLDRSLKRYRDFFTATTEDDGQSIVFGPEFARAYADALGIDQKKPPRR